MLRKIVIVVAAFALIVAIGLLALEKASLVSIAIWVAGEAVIVLLALLLERGRYRPSAASGPWVPTAERFQDPTSGRWIRVEYNPETGERRYVEEGSLTPDP